MYYVSGSVESIFCSILQFNSGQSSKLLVESLQGILADEISSFPTHDDVEQDFRETLDPNVYLIKGCINIYLHPDWKVVHTRGPECNNRHLELQKYHLSEGNYLLFN